MGMYTSMLHKDCASTEIMVRQAAPAHNMTKKYYGRITGKAGRPVEACSERKRTDFRRGD